MELIVNLVLAVGAEGLPQKHILVITVRDVEKTQKDVPLFVCLIVDHGIMIAFVV
jgi:hypothetical protein